MRDPFKPIPIYDEDGKLLTHEWPGSTVETSSDRVPFLQQPRDVTPTAHQESDAWRMTAREQFEAAMESGNRNTHTSVCGLIETIIHGDPLRAALRSLQSQNDALAARLDALEAPAVDAPKAKPYHGGPCGLGVVNPLCPHCNTSEKIEPCGLDPEERCGSTCGIKRKDHTRIKTHDYEPEREFLCSGCPQDIVWTSDSICGHPSYDHDFSPVEYPQKLAPKADAPKPTERMSASWRAEIDELIEANIILPRGYVRELRDELRRVETDLAAEKITSRVIKEANTRIAEQLEEARKPRPLSDAAVKAAVEAWHGPVSVHSRMACAIEAADRARESEKHNAD